MSITICFLKICSQALEFHWGTSIQDTFFLEGILMCYENPPGVRLLSKARQVGP